MLATLLAATVGVKCGPASIRVTNRAPDPTLVDERGDVDEDGFAALVAAVEAQRGLGFIQRPHLELIAADDSRLPALRADARALEPCPATVAASPVGSERAGEPSGPGCFADPGLEFVQCLAPPDLDAARRVLRRLLDAQNYPRLAHAAPLLRGDPGVAIRSLLAASASGASGAGSGSAPPRDPASLDLLQLSQIEVERREDPGSGCVDMASAFLASQNDREAPFRTPPLSTLMMVRPQAYRASQRPLLLLGKPLDVAGCEVASDESLGVARILVALLAKGGSIPGAALAGWRGDRALTFTCGSEPAPWIYVVELADEVRAADFAAAAPRLLLGVFPGRSETQRIGRRVVIDHEIGAQAARGWAVSLQALELVRFEGLE